MTARYPLLYRFIQIIALAAIVLAVAAPGWLGQMTLPAALALIVLVGIPHGATDHLIFRHLDQSFLGGRRLPRFYLNYLLLMTGYSLLWWLAPWLALAAFLLLSIYHFGQSNWNYASFGNRWEALFTYVIWGTLIVFAPLLFHYEEAAVIVGRITGQAPPMLDSGWRLAILGMLLLTNLWWTVYLAFHYRINTSHLRDEWINLLTLGILFYVTPLLLGFAIYFAFWHSLSSMLDQIGFFRQHVKVYNWRRYLVETLPFSLVAILGLAGLVWLEGQLGVGMNIGMLFIFISVVTLPHMLLIDRLYDEFEQEVQVRKSEEYSYTYP